MTRGMVGVVSLACVLIALLLRLLISWYPSTYQLQQSSTSSGILLKGENSDTADRVITYGPEPIEPSLTFSENWPATQQICVREGCLTLQQIREQVIAQAKP